LLVWRCGGPAPAPPGRSWYAGRVHDPLPETFAERERAAEVVDGLVAALAARGHDRVVLAGFSQGACLVADHLLRRPGRPAAAVVWTGAAFGPPGTSWPAPSGPPPLAGLPVLLTNGDADAWVPLTATEALASLLRGRGADVELRVQPGRGHEVADDEVDAAAALLRRVGDG
jgi:predicted esterase